MNALAGEKSEEEGRAEFLRLLRKGGLEEMKITVSREDTRVFLSVAR